MSNVLLSIHKLGFIHRDIKPDNLLLDNKVGRPLALVGAMFYCLYTSWALYTVTSSPTICCWTTRWVDRSPCRSNVLLSIHKLGFIHRDIKPDNLLLDNKVGRPLALVGAMFYCLYTSWALYTVTSSPTICCWTTRWVDC